MTRDATEDGRVPSAARPRPLPDIIWIRERPDDYLVDDEYLISTHEPIFGNPEDFVRKAKTDPLAAALQEILDTGDVPLAGTDRWHRYRTALTEYQEAERLANYLSEAERALRST